ncbi:MAG: DUF3035 domain-containing protein [Rhodobacteraceae bacterium]|nr:DUF3035 domain-containing protein [Paracoccaceae bacterium]
MRRARFAMAGVLAAALVVAGCGERSGDPRLMNLRATSGPDEFAILPTRPIEVPRDLATLPQPTPGAGNRVDRQPRADAVAALGGNPRLLDSGVIPAADQALVTSASRHGVASGIRETLAAEDLEFRRNNRGRLLERMFNVNTYYRAYGAVTLDQYAELERMRRAGVRTPAAPPPEEMGR